MAIHRIGRSQLGVAHRSQLGVLEVAERTIDDPPPPGVAGDVLILAPAVPPLLDEWGERNDIRIVYASRNSQIEESIDLRSFRLIIDVWGATNHSVTILQYLSGWAGRVLIVGENHTYFSQANSWLNTYYSSFTGMSLGSDSLDNATQATPKFAPTVGMGVTFGVPILYRDWCNSVTLDPQRGGVAISQLVDEPAKIYIARNRVGNLEFYMVGDVNIGIHQTLGQNNQTFEGSPNERFLINLATLQLFAR